MPEPAECRLCPRDCRARRSAGGRGRCGAGAEVQVALADLHHWEEPPVSGSGGAGAVFFSGCPLGCVFCQNHEISRGAAGRALSTGELAQSFLELQERGAATIDLVTGTPYAVQIAAAVQEAKAMGLHLPVVWNSSGYETVETLRMLAGTVDVYLPDFKYWSEQTAVRYAGAPDYRRRAKLAIAEMIRQQPRCELSGEGILTHGVLVRHLVMPGSYPESARILRYLASAWGSSIWVSLMRQYTPAGSLEGFPELQSLVDDAAYERLAALAEDLGFGTLFTQEAGCASSAYIPGFGS